MSTLYLTDAGRESYDPEQERERGIPTGQETYHDDVVATVTSGRRIICSTEEREEFENELHVRLDADVLHERLFNDFQAWLTENHGLCEQGKEPSALEEIQEQDHWSGPSGCHHDCPACAAERTDEEEAEHQLEEHCSLHAKEIVIALNDLLNICADPNVHALVERFPKLREQIQRASELHAKLEPKGKTKPLPETGEMGLRYSVVDEVIQSLAKDTVDRGNVTKVQMLSYLATSFDADKFWSRYGGPAMDWLEFHAAKY